MYELIKFVPMFPLIGFLFLGLFGKKIKSEPIKGWIAALMVGISFLITCFIFFHLLSNPSDAPTIITLYQWIGVGNFMVDISYQVDQLSMTFAMFVTGIGFLIHIYSIGYMHGDRSFYRFFSYLNLFIFMMLNLILASNYLLTFLGWEGVGLASYLLIGFWYDRKFEGVNITWTGDAGMKAFVVNRIGDFGFLIAMFLIFTTFNTLNYNDVAASANANYSMYLNSGIITAITMTMFLGCTGKSAQLPLAIWLPDAMAGPTSVSALIHAATMVTAGIFIVARNSVLFSLSETAMMTVAIVGVVTAFSAATIGIVQNDIKKVLAYSTVSQLGFMFVALGVGAFYIGVFHVITHAFFKGLLFLAAGSVIHGMHHEQNIKKMGGLKKYMPTTAWTFLVGTLAIAGIPIFAGFMSKDEILWYAWSSPHGNWFLWLSLVIAAMFTAFYMFRLYYLTFEGEERFDHKHVHPHESPKIMTVVLVILAVFSTFAGFINLPPALMPWSHSDPWLKSWLSPIFADANVILGHHSHHGVETMMYVLMIVATGAAFVMWYVARKWYLDPKLSNPNQLVQSSKPLYNLLLHKYRLDEFYYAVIINPIKTASESVLWKITDIGIIDGLVHSTAKLILSTGSGLKYIQTGIVQNYAILMIAGILVILGWFVLA
ncbi:MAG TPA: NADH-quinone oxidoreductase subunit L [Candidatus Kapabacteria bacterium]|nr:NADH-quinone oxidoreductase subunit L [Candidatus Kapabacteria bacterium]